MKLWKKTIWIWNFLFLPKAIMVEYLNRSFVVGLRSPFGLGWYPLIIVLEHREVNLDIVVENSFARKLMATDDQVHASIRPNINWTVNIFDSSQFLWEKSLTLYPLFLYVEFVDLSRYNFVQTLADEVCHLDLYSEERELFLFWS